VNYSNNIYVGEAKITGTRPLLWHHFGADILSTEKKERTGIAGNDPDEWQKSVLLTAEKQLYVEPTYIFGCIREGDRYTKRGRGTLLPLVSATLQVLDDKVLIDKFIPDVLDNDRNKEVYLDVRSVKNPVTKGRNIRYRVAAAAGWKTSFIILWDKTIISKNEMEAILRDAGMYSGIGDGRSIGYGRFIVEEFGMLENA
jgi:hypothetical protein